MFENLSEKLQRAFKTLRGQAVLTDENIQEALRQIRLALLEADVNFKVVKQLIDQIQAKAVGQQVATALSPGEQVIKIVRDELVAMLGQDTAKMKFASQPPTVVLMAGLQGSGKTTTSGKLANWLKKYAAKLDVRYVIWQGKIWSVARSSEGWRNYTAGSGVTGGHYDHVHVSMQNPYGD